MSSSARRKRPIQGNCPHPARRPGQRDVEAVDTNSPVVWQVGVRPGVRAHCAGLHEEIKVDWALLRPLEVAGPRDGHLEVHLQIRGCRGWRRGTPGRGGVFARALKVAVVAHNVIARAGQTTPTTVELNKAALERCLRTARVGVDAVPEALHFALVAVDEGAGADGIRD
eukprot:scaffold273_cov349-Prasinococcus_capsulatus_cf.AAC.7